MGFILFVFCSCHEQKADGLSSTPAFDSIFVAADKLSDSGFRNEALAIVMNAHSRMPHLTTEDEINYYTYCNIIYNHDGQHDKSIVLADSMLMVLDKATVTPSVQSWRIVAYNIKADALFAEGM
ncbi:MAG: hypothetical protein K9G49_16705 [Taibaiella sp.]|nr:hypothetical protein [Taibaiella sp.]